VIYPDEGTRVLFEGCRAHACLTANVYFLVTPDATSMDILWGSDRGVRTLGPNAGLLAERRIYERLWEIKASFAEGRALIEPLTSFLTLWRPAAKLAATGR